MMARLQHALALFAAALLFAHTAHAYWIPAGLTRPSDDLISLACRGQTSGGTARNVCWPTNSPRNYIRCQTNGRATAENCPTGYLFDYVRRACTVRDRARVCPWWPVPEPFQFGLPNANNTGGPALTVPFGAIGQPGNTTLELTVAGNFLLFCPLIGHGPLGQNLDLNVDCPAPLDRTPYTFSINLMPVVQNSDPYPRRQPSINAYCGDSLHVTWTDPFHIGQFLNLSPYARSLWANQRVMSRPPQPVYLCPVWRYVPNPARPGTVMLVPNPGDEVVVSPLQAAWNYTMTPNATGSFFVVEPASAYCRLGMVFKVTVQAAGSSPTTYTVNWAPTMDNYPDLTINLGDSILFLKPSPVQNSGIIRLPSLPLIDDLPDNK